MKTINLDATAKYLHDTAVEKGFWEPKEGENQVNQILAKMMLVNTEVSEMADAYVKQRGSEEITKECADIIIRLLDLMQAMKDYGVIEHSVQEIMNEKMLFNKNRPAKHDRLM